MILVQLILPWHQMRPPTFLCSPISCYSHVDTCLSSPNQTQTSLVSSVLNLTPLLWFLVLQAIFWLPAVCIGINLFRRELCLISVLNNLVVRALIMSSEIRLDWSHLTAEIPYHLFENIF